MKPVVRKTILHLFGATGGGALGFKQVRVDVAGMRGEWRCLGSIDIDAGANQIFAARVGAPAITLDLSDRSQYRAINGREPPEGWREATPKDLQDAAHGIRPDCIFLSAPCKGFSGLLPEAKSANAKYQAMNGLAERGLWLALEAWRDDPVSIILFENVPRLLSRGRAFADQIVGMLRAFGYATAETVHDCGEIGELGQSRKRCLIVARHVEKVPNFLYEPVKRPLRSVGDVIGRMWLPGDAAAGPMHRVPRLQWKTWVRLAFVEAGSDWRSLNKLSIENGHLRDYLIVPEMHRGVLGVRKWGEPTGTVTGESRPVNGAFSVADPRVVAHENYSHAGFRVVEWDKAAGTVTGARAPGSSAQAIADPRCLATKHNNCFRVVPFDHAAGTVTAGGHPGAGGQAVADPRGPQEGRLFGKYHCAGWDDTSRTVIGGDNNGAYAVADPRSGMDADRAAYLTGGHYGVLPWGGTAGAVSAAACHDNGRWSVADPRLPSAVEQLVCRITALDGTWHRPFTTLELAALQSAFDPDDPDDVFAFTGAMTAASQSDSQHREWIGNMVPPKAGAGIGQVILRTLLLADAGETFALSAAPIWVRPYVAALQLAGRGGEA